MAWYWCRYYIEKYNLEGQVLPHTAILDPRTGAQLLKVVGFVEPEDLSMALVEFLEENSIDQVSERSAVSLPDSSGRARLSNLSVLSR